MRLTLFQKLFGAFFVTSLLMVGLMVGFLQFSIASNFSNYVDQVDLEKSQEIVEALGQFYQQHQGWQKIQGDHRYWYGLILQNIQQFSSIPDRPPGFRREQQRQSRNDWKEWEHRFRMGQQDRPNRPWRHLHPRFIKRFSLYDVNKNLIAGRGNSIENHLLKPIQINDATVGWLGLRKIEKLSNPLDILFLKQYTRALYFIGGGLFLFSLLVSYLISRPLVSKIKHLAKGARDIASRQFSTRIDVQSSDELGNLAADFNQMAQTLENYENYRKQWISDISHELGTPLSIIRGGLEAMLDGVRDTTPEHLNKLHAEACHLGQIANDLRLLSLGDTGGLSLDKTSLSPVNLLKDTAENFQNKFAEQSLDLQLELEYHASIQVMGDAQRLKQLFSNLLENGLRYVSSPGSMTLKTRSNDSDLILCFEDSGPGVPEEALPHLFERFYRVEESRNRTQGGSGLGLAICKQIADAHGGTITATNLPAGGLQIEITFPKI
ncbi:MAG: HAMP domain-containing protein [SAR324 cluster bacterium]|nr:HAMP domain-containing protein [SAR324 cluster bacterium]